MILKKKVFGSAMLAAAIMSAGTCTAMAAPQQENTANRMCAVCLSDTPRRGRE